MVKKYIFYHFILTSVHHLVLETKILQNRPIAPYYFCTCYTAFSDEPAYKAQIFQPAPKPLRNSHTASALTTPFASHAPTLNGEPISAERIISFSDVVTIFVEFLIQNFPGKKIRSQLRSSTLYVQLFARKLLLMRTFMSFDYWMKWVQQQRPLPPIFEKFIATDFTKKTKTPSTVRLSTTSLTNCRSGTPRPPIHRTHQKNDQR